MRSFIQLATIINSANANVDWSFAAETPLNTLDEKMNNAHNLYTN